MCLSSYGHDISDKVFAGAKKNPLNPPPAVMNCWVVGFWCEFFENIDVPFGWKLIMPFI